MADTTTIQVSTATRDRLKQLGDVGATYDETIGDALELLEEQRFDAELRSYAAKLGALTPEEQALRQAYEAAMDAKFSALH